MPASNPSIIDQMLPVIDSLQKCEIGWVLAGNSFFVGSRYTKLDHLIKVIGGIDVHFHLGPSIALCLLEEGKPAY